ncbi:MAG: RidA family protein [Nitrosopumilaceae archaeon]|nr:MAG: Endoribonuclease L-PSP [Nitrosopumilales archaeon]
MIDEKLKSLNIILPNAPKPAGSYIPVVISNNIAYVSGQIPVKEGKVVFSGKVPTQQSIEEAGKAAKLCAINALAQLKASLGNLDRINKIIRVSGFVNSTPEFDQQPTIINSASDLLFNIFGEKGKHTRIAVGVASLPLESTVEIDMIVEIS